MNDQDLLTLYAGLAMQAFITRGSNASHDSIAKSSFNVAEAMVKEREERDERLRPTQGN
jgi:hypothetical protein